MGKMNEKRKYWRGWIVRLIILLYDLVAVNFAYLIAVILRFSDSASYYEQGARYMGMYRSFAPWYTVACIVIFFLFHLYNGVWRYAGFNDLKKLLWVGGCTCVIYVCGSLLIVGRMPVSVYIMGAIIQFIMISLVRMLPRLLSEYFGRTKQESINELMIPLMIIGMGENARIIQDRISKDRTNIVKPVCVVDHAYAYRGNSFNGLPVYSGIEGCRTAIDKYGIRCAIVAESDIPKEFLNRVRSECNEKNIEMRDFVIGTEYKARGIKLKDILLAVKGPVCIVEEDNEKRFNNARDALKTYNDNLAVGCIYLEKDILCINVSNDNQVQYESNEDWVGQYRSETGSDISFF